MLRFALLWMLKWELLVSPRCELSCPLPSSRLCGFLLVALMSLRCFAAALLAVWFGAVGTVRWGKRPHLVRGWCPTAASTAGAHRNQGWQPMGERWRGTRPFPGVEGASALDCYLKVPNKCVFFFLSWAGGICLFSAVLFVSSELWYLPYFFFCSVFLHCYFFSKLHWLKSNGA